MIVAPCLDMIVALMISEASTKTQTKVLGINFTVGHL